MGIVFGLTGFMFGFGDWTMARRRSLDHRLSIIAMLLCLLVLAVDVVVGVLGLQTVTFGSP